MSILFWFFILYIPISQISGQKCRFLGSSNYLYCTCTGQWLWNVKPSVLEMLGLLILEFYPEELLLDVMDINFKQAKVTNLQSAHRVIKKHPCLDCQVKRVYSAANFESLTSKYNLTQNNFSQVISRFAVLLRIIALPAKYFRETRKPDRADI